MKKNSIKKIEYSPPESDLYARKFMLKKFRVTFLSSLGAGLEYYDFIIYGLLSSYLMPLFFKSVTGKNGLLQIFMVFAVGYLARPLGGIIFGMIADQRGRKIPFVIIMFLMASSTFLIGILPTAEYIGFLAPLLLTLLRIVQGVSFGAELPAAITIISEYNNRNSVGFHSSLVISSTSVGAALASIVLMIITSILTVENMSSWGWRLPFIFGGFLAVVTFVIRTHLHETPAFQKIKSKNENSSFFAPLLELLKSYRKELLICITINFLTSSLVVMNIYYSTYLKIYFEYNSDQIFCAMTISVLSTILILPLLGWLGDKYNRKNILYYSIIIFIGLGYFVFQQLSNKTFFSLLNFLSFQQIFTCACISSTLPITALLFPTHVRFTGIGFCYNSAYVLASLIPLFLTYIFQIYNHDMIIFYGISCTALFVVFILFKYRNSLTQSDV